MSRWRALFAASTRKRWLAAALGAAVVLSFEPFELVWLAPLAMACLILLWEGATPRQAAWIGFSFGLGLFTAGTYWLYISLNILGGLWPPLALLLMLALILVMAGYTALAGYAVVQLTPGSGMARWLLAAPAVWTLTEWLRGWLFTGFPWLSLGYSQVDTPLAGLAPVVGVYGVSWAVVAGAGAIVCLAQGTRAARLMVLLAGAAAVAGILHLNTIAWTESTGRELRVTLVQGAVPQELKWTRQQLQPTLDLYSRLSAEQGERDLILWPEAAIPALPFEIPEFLADLNTTMRERDTQLLTGILTYDVERGEYRNTLWAMGPEEGMYFKRHLVVFGEFFPLPDFAKHLLRIMNLPSESIVPGPDRQPLLNVKGVPVAATICYEIAFAAEQLQYFPGCTADGQCKQRCLVRRFDCAASASADQPDARARGRPFHAARNEHGHYCCHRPVRSGSQASSAVRVRRHQRSRAAICGRHALRPAGQSAS